MGEVIRGMTEPHTQCYMMYMFSFNSPQRMALKNNPILFFPFGAKGRGVGVNALRHKNISMSAFLIQSMRQRQTIVVEQRLVQELLLQEFPHPTF